MESDVVGRMKLMVGNAVGPELSWYPDAVGCKLSAHEVDG